MIEAMLNETIAVRTHTRAAKATYGYSLWEFTGAQWDLRKDASLAGCIPGKPPRGTGLFPGQVRAIPSVAQ